MVVFQDGTIHVDTKVEEGTATKLGVVSQA